MPRHPADGVLAHRHPVVVLDPLARRCESLLDAVIVLLATWTLVYHLCFLLGLDSTVALLLEVLVLAAVLVAARRRAAPPSEPSAEAAADLVPAGDLDSASAHRWLASAVVVAATVAAVSMALRLPWLLVWVPWLVAAGAGAVWALRTLPATEDAATEEAATADTDGGPGQRPAGRREALLVLGLGVALAALSLVVNRPNPDDLFYVNLSQWVAAHGTFPHRDTIYADLVYPLSNWPPLASYDAGVGAVAHLLGIHAATVAYLVVPPIATLLSVLALWRLLRAWRVRHVLVALGVAVVFLMLDGTAAYGPPGNLWLTRLWQGKVILLCVVVPWLLVAALGYVRSPGRLRAGWLVVGGVAAVACSTTAIFLVPVIAVAGAAPLLRRAPRRAAISFAAMAGYPLLMGVLTKAVGGRSADDFGARRQYRFDPAWFGHEVFLDGAIALVAVAAVLVGCLLVPHPAARVTTAAAAALTGVTLIPGLTHLGYDSVGIGPTLWRLTWSLSVAALVGAAASHVATVTKRRRRPALAVTAVTAAVVTALVTALVTGQVHPILAPDTSTAFAAPLHWQRTTESLTATAWILDHTGPGERVLAPDGLAVTVAVSTTVVKTVTPRDYYMDYLRHVPGFDYDQRLALTRFANHDDGWQPAQIAPALAALDVGVACVYLPDHDATRVLRRAGYLSGTVAGPYRCLRAPAPERQPTLSWPTPEPNLTGT